MHTIVLYKSWVWVGTILGPRDTVVVGLFLRGSGKFFLFFIYSNSLYRILYPHQNRTVGLCIYSVIDENESHYICIAPPDLVAACS